MYGLVLNGFLEFAEEALGETEFDGFISAMERASFVDLCNYDDAIFFGYVKQFADHTHTSQFTVLHNFGLSFPSKIHSQSFSFSLSHIPFLQNSEDNFQPPNFGV